MTDASATLYPTKFFDCTIDESVPNLFNSNNSDLILTADRWDVFVVGEKKVDNVSHPIISVFDDQLNHIFTQYFDITVKSQLVDMNFNQISPYHSPVDKKIGHYVAGVDSRLAGPQGGSIVIVCRVLGQYSTLDAGWAYQVVTPGMNPLALHEIRELEDKSIVILIEHTLKAKDNSYWSILHLNADGTVRAAWASRIRPNTESIADIVANVDPTTGMLDFDLVGRYFYSNLGQTALENECFLQPINVVEVLDKSISQDDRQMAVFDERFVECPSGLIQVPVEFNEECAELYDNCSTESGTVQLWGSHYDRGNDIAFYGADLISTGLSAGPYHAPKVAGTECFDECSDLADPLSVSTLAKRGMDCHIIFTDSDFKFSANPNYEYGWYRLLIDPVDVIVACYPEVYTDRGNQSFDVGYDISSHESRISVSGSTINRTNASGFSCWDGDLLDGAGDVNATLFEVDNLGKQTVIARAVVFGKTHSNVATTGSKFKLVENFYNLHDIDDKVANNNTLARPQAVSAEIFYAHSTTSLSGTGRNSPYLTSAVGLTTTSSYDLDPNTGLAPVIS